MEQLRGYIRTHARLLAGLALALIGLAWLLFYRLGNLTGGLSADELRVAAQPVGWHGIYHQPLNLPLQVTRSVVFWLAPAHGAFLTRLPNVVWGGLAVGAFAWLIWLWHGARTAILATALFAFSAWTLHVSRLASFDVLYLWAMPSLLLVQAGLTQHSKRPLVWYGALLLWGLMIYVPGLIWLVILSIWLQRQAIFQGWQQFKRWWQRLLTILTAAVWLSLLAIDLSHAGQLKQWLGLPTHLASPIKLVEQLGHVLIHLLVRGPRSSELWLGRLPILDVFSLTVFGVGAYFYISHWRARRSQTLGWFFIIGIVLVALNGAVGLSLVVPVLYIVAATGIAYLIHEWLAVFPRNPLARSVGIGLVTLAVVTSCLYGYRTYFVAWPHNSSTIATFRYHQR